VPRKTVSNNGLFALSANIRPSLTRMDDRIFSRAAYTIRRKPAIMVSATSVPMFRLPKTRSYTWSMYRGPTNASRFMKKLKTMAVAKPGRIALEASAKKDGRRDMRVASRRL
jgi:hypothetical protein